MSPEIKSSEIKEKVSSDLQKAKAEGQVRTDRIKDIVQNAVLQTASEVKEGSREIRVLVKDAVIAVIESLRDRGETVKENVIASTEGALEAVSRTRRQSIAKTQTEIKQLQAKIDAEEQDLQTEIDSVLNEIEETGSSRFPDVKTAISEAIDAVKDTEEAALMRKRYAQLQSQLAVLQANLAAKYGEQDGEVNRYLEDAKAWYDRAKTDFQSGNDRVQAKQADFEQKLGETGSAVARKEKQVKQRLKELWKATQEVFKEDHV